MGLGAFVVMIAEWGRPHKDLFSSAQKDTVEWRDNCEISPIVSQLPEQTCPQDKEGSGS